MSILSKLPQVNAAKAFIGLGLLVLGAVLFFVIKGLIADVKETSREAGGMEVTNEVLNQSNKELGKAVQADRPDLRRDYCRCVRYNAEPAACKQLLPADFTDDIQCSLRPAGD